MARIPAAISRWRMSVDAVNGVRAYRSRRGATCSGDRGIIELPRPVDAWPVGTRAISRAPKGLRRPYDDIAADQWRATARFERSFIATDSIGRLNLRKYLRPARAAVKLFSRPGRGAQGG